MLRFIHTADWQLGKPFARVADAEKRARLRQERLAVIARIGEVAQAQGAAFVLVAGDLFDSTTPDKSTVSAACAAIGAIGLPVVAIPGNHDHAGPGSIWEQEFFLSEQRALAPNFRLLDRCEPQALEGAILLPCPLRRQQDADDPTAWLRRPDVWAGLPADRPRLVLAHGSTQGFSSAVDDEDGGGQPNRLDLDRLPREELDYIALGDWHGKRAVNAWAWYSGTPELDRFPKGETHDPGHVLSVSLAGRGQTPVVTSLRTGRLGWHHETFTLVGDESLASLESHLVALLGGRTQQDLLRLDLEGTLGVGGAEALRGLLERWEARLLRLKLDDRVQVTPSDAERMALVDRAGDPLISALASRLAATGSAGGEAAALARLAYRELYAAVERAEGDGP